MSDGRNRVSKENEVFEDRGEQDPKRLEGDAASRSVNRGAAPTEEEDVDETMAGGLSYPDGAEPGGDR